MIEMKRDDLKYQICLEEKIKEKNHDAVDFMIINKILIFQETLKIMRNHLLMFKILIIFQKTLDFNYIYFLNF